MNFPIERGGKGEFDVNEVYFPEKGGVFLDVKGFKYPYRGFALPGMVEDTGIMKSIVPIVAVMVKEFMKFPTPGRIWTMRKTMKRLMPMMLDTFYNSIGGLDRRFVPLQKRYCRSVREIDNTFAGWYPHKFEDVKDIRYWARIRRLLCMILEFDNAYRYRMQDLASEIDTKRIQKKFLRETNRLFNILIERENSKGMKEKWKVVKQVILVSLFFERKIQRYIKEIIAGIDFKKLQLTEDDRYWCWVRTDYNFGGNDHRRSVKVAKLNKGFPKEDTEA